MTTKNKIKSDECLKCPRMLKLQMTPEGKKFCEYCLTRQAILRSNGKIVDNYVFQEDFAMGLYNRLQLWGSKPFACPQCGCKDFTVDIEVHESTQEGIFKSVPNERVVVVCKNGHRFYPDDSMRTHGFSKSVANDLTAQATKGLK
jgi:predicted nucleic-acid-binding Zn-ribbon protein